MCSSRRAGPKTRNEPRRGDSRDSDSPPPIAIWHIWRSVGRARVAEELASRALSEIVDDLNNLGPEVRRAAHESLAENLKELDRERRWTSFRTWAAFVISVLLCRLDRRLLDQAVGRGTERLA